MRGEELAGVYRPNTHAVVLPGGKDKAPVHVNSNGLRAGEP
jgi:hypothetical protein